MKLVNTIAFLAVLTLYLTFSGGIAQGQLIDIEVSVNGEDADTSPGPEIPVGTQIEWVFEVTNNAGVPITELAITDKTGPVPCPSCLQVGESVTCITYDTAEPGQNVNIGEVTGKTLFQGLVSDEDPAYYCGIIDDPIPGDVVIDVKPGVDPNIINPKSKGVIPVAIITTDDFNAAEIDGSTVQFGPNGAKPIHGDGHLEDVGGDDRIDWLGHFRTQEILVAQELVTTQKAASQVADAEAAVEVTLTGKTSGEEEFAATDQIVIVSKSKAKAPPLRSLRGLTTTWGMLKTRY